jgi:hypothetical protein
MKEKELRGKVIVENVNYIVAKLSRKEARQAS